MLFIDCSKMARIRIITKSHQRETIHDKKWIIRNFCKIGKAKQSIGWAELNMCIYKSENRFQLLEDEGDTNDPIADSLLEQTTTIIKKAANEVLGIHRPKKKPWISDATLALTDERRKARKKAIQDPSFRHEYRSVTGKFFRGGKAFFLIFEKKKKKKKKRRKKKKKKKVLSSFCNYPSFHFHIFNFPPSFLQFSFFSSPFPPPLFHFFLASFFSRPSFILKIVAAVKKLKAGKAPGTDKIPGEFLKHDGDCIIDQLHHICNDIWMKETIPDDWAKSIILTPTKGDITKCENYRTISLINHSSKILLEIIQSRMKPMLKPS